MEHQEQNAIPELLNEFRKTASKISEIVRESNTQIRDAAHEIALSFQQLQEGLPHNVQVLAAHGWFSSHWHTPLATLKASAELFENGESGAANEYLCNHFSEISVNINATLIKNHPNREKIIVKAFRAHERGDYELAIPAFLTQAEGIGKQSLGASIHSRKPPIRRQLANEVLAISNSIASYYPMLRLILEDLPITESTGQEAYDPNSLNRHAILHGIDCSYGTRLNSFRAISWLQYADQFCEAAKWASPENE